jgi:hypothetical protein
MNAASGIGHHRRTAGLTVAETVDGLPRRISGWAVGSWLTPASMAGISVALSLVAAGWFTAGTMADSSIGAVVLCGSYLTGRSARGLAGPLVGSWARMPGERRLGQVGGIVADTVVIAALAVGGTVAAGAAVGSAGSGAAVGGSVLSATVLGATVRGHHRVGGHLVGGHRVGGHLVGGHVVGGHLVGGHLVGAPLVGGSVVPLMNGTAGSGAAAGAGAAGQGDLWRLAIAVLVLMAIRQVAAACSDPAQPGREQEASIEGLIWRILALPPGGQMLLVAIVVPVWGDETALTGLACWAVVAIASMLVSRSAVPAEVRSIAACRDDGPLARWLGRPVRGQLVPLPPALTGLAAASVLAVLGLRDLPGLLLLAPVVAMLLAAVGSSHPHDGRFDWIAPALLQAGQYVYIVALGFASGVPALAIFVLCALIALHYADLAGRPQGRTALGWEGRMLAVGLGAALGIATFAYVVLAAYVGWLICRELRSAGGERWRETAGDRYGPGGRRGAQAPA